MCLKTNILFVSFNFSFKEILPHHPGPLAEILLYKLRTDNADEGGRCVVCDCLGQHGLAAARGPVHEDTARRIDTDLT